MERFHFPKSFIVISTDVRNIYSFSNNKMSTLFPIFGIVLPRLLINQYVSQKLARFECMNNNTDVIDFFEEYEQFKLKLEKHTEEYKKKKLQEKKYLWKVIGLKANKVFPKEKFVDDVDEITMDSSFIKKLLNVVSGNNSRRLGYAHNLYYVARVFILMKIRKIFCGTNILFYSMRERFSRTKFSYKTVVKELRDMNFCISENTLSRFYRRVCTELSSVVKQNVNTLVFGCYSNILFYYTSNNPVFNSFRMDRFRRLEM
uniref:Uncharacterized protein n=1 Tax=Rhizophagus irregularis (strain DAOM 181602 / DAOM 197198 / MUCL 43194) TaxID=747089 RepID=U9TEV4_RHIID